MMLERIQSIALYSSIIPDVYFLKQEIHEPLSPALIKQYRAKSHAILKRVSQSPEAKRYLEQAMYQLALYLLQQNYRAFSIYDISQSNTSVILAPLFTTANSINTQLDQVKIVEVITSDILRSNTTLKHRQLKDTMIEEVTTPKHFEQVNLLDRFSAEASLTDFSPYLKENHPTEHFYTFESHESREELKDQTEISEQISVPFERSQVRGVKELNESSFTECNVKDSTINDSIQLTARIFDSPILYLRKKQQDYSPAQKLPRYETMRVFERAPKSGGHKVRQKTPFNRSFSDSHLKQFTEVGKSPFSIRSISKFYNENITENMELCSAFNHVYIFRIQHLSLHEYHAAKAISLHFQELKQRPRFIELVLFSERFKNVLKMLFYILPRNSRQFQHFLNFLLSLNKLYAFELALECCIIRREGGHYFNQCKSDLKHYMLMKFGPKILTQYRGTSQKYLINNFLMTIEQKSEITELLERALSTLKQHLYCDEFEWDNLIAGVKYMGQQSFKFQILNCIQSILQKLSTKLLSKEGLIKQLEFAQILIRSLNELNIGAYKKKNEIIEILVNLFINNDFPYLGRAIVEFLISNMSSIKVRTLILDKLKTVQGYLCQNLADRTQVKEILEVIRAKQFQFSSVQEIDLLLNVYFEDRSYFTILQKIIKFQSQKLLSELSQSLLLRRKEILSTLKALLLHSFMTSNQEYSIQTCLTFLTDKRVVLKLEAIKTLYKLLKRHPVPSKLKTSLQSVRYVLQDFIVVLQSQHPYFKYIIKILCLLFSLFDCDSKGVRKIYSLLIEHKEVTNKMIGTLDDLLVLFDKLIKKCDVQGLRQLWLQIHLLFEKYFIHTHTKTKTVLFRKLLKLAKYSLQRTDFIRADLSPQIFRVLRRFPKQLVKKISESEDEIIQILLSLLTLDLDRSVIIEILRTLQYFQAFHNLALRCEMFRGEQLHTNSLLFYNLDWSVNYLKGLKKTQASQSADSIEETITFLLSSIFAGDKDSRVFNSHIQSNTDISESSRFYSFENTNSEHPKLPPHLKSIQTSSFSSSGRCRQNCSSPHYALKNAATYTKNQRLKEKFTQREKFSLRSSSFSTSFRNLLKQRSESGIATSAERGLKRKNPDSSSLHSFKDFIKQTANKLFHKGQESTLTLKEISPILLFCRGEYEFPEQTLLVQFCSEKEIQSPETLVQMLYLLKIVNIFPREIQKFKSALETNKKKEFVVQVLSKQMFEELLDELNNLKEQHKFQQFIQQFYSQFLLKLVCSLIEEEESKKSKMLHTIFNSIEFETKIQIVQKLQAFQADLLQKKLTNQGLHNLAALKKAIEQPLKQIRGSNNVYGSIKELKSVLKSAEIVNLVISDFVTRSAKLVGAKISVDLYSGIEKNLEEADARELLESIAMRVKIIQF